MSNYGKYVGRSRYIVLRSVMMSAARLQHDMAARVGKFAYSKIYAHLQCPTAESVQGELTPHVEHDAYRISKLVTISKKSAPARLPFERSPWDDTVDSAEADTPRSDGTMVS